MNLLDAGIRRIFGVFLADLAVDLGVPWGQWYASAAMAGAYSDSTTYDGDPVQRLLRHIYSVEISGWIPSEGELVRTVRHLRTNYVSSLPGSPPVDDLLLSIQLDLPIEE